MTDVTVYSLVAGIAALLGMIAGRVFAIECGKGLTSIFAAAYIAAGVGLMSSIMIGPILALVAQYLSSGTTTWFNALEVAGTSLLWGTAAGAAGGMAIGMVIAVLPSRWFAR
ncbi:MAG: hypothetical protein BGN89_15055 [Alphaproteobacteria bacterium 64-6]|uniref:hypothetical protein n=1 Tax=Hyphomicrobium sp. CS1BSMeth3 TaxID=1892844 RepID=UPI000931D03E|nr:hypothetical protein [Hyphomicrobium sp. CS1BSMeth3]MBN9268266.1 hypothetical protein [Hyphomicrobium sp.]OJU23045.1 MAG: hypothetical protein BGN89_15055 [Alphaproteobacteria bacterium 64-6]